MSDLSTSAKGAKSELLAAAYLIGQGWEVFRALSPASALDLIAIRGDEIRKIDVKTGRRYSPKTGKKYLSNKKKVQFGAKKNDVGKWIMVVEYKPDGTHVIHDIGILKDKDSSMIITEVYF